MPPAPAPWQPQGTSASRPSRAPVILSTAIALLAVALAIAAWLRPPQEPEAQPDTPQFSEQEIATAEQAMCEAWNHSLTAILHVGGKNSPDSTLTYVLGVETQVVFDAAADYLQSSLRENPATPEELADAFKRLISSYYEAVLAHLANASEDDIEPIKSPWMPPKK